MQLYKSTYGPQGLSCLTCRQRRKKCDRTRPVCKRCIKGQFRCLGYDNDPPEALLAECQLTQTAERLDPANVSSGPREMPIQVRSAEVQSGNILVSSPTFIFGSLDENPGATPSHGSSAHLGSFDRSGIAITSTGILELSPQSHRGSKDLPDMNELEAFNQTWPQEQSQCLVRTRTFDPGTTRSYSTFRLNIPRAVNANAQMRGDYFTFILSEYEIHRLRKFFKPPPMPLSSGLAARMKRSNTILGFMYLGAKVFEALSGRPIDAVWKCCKRWIASFDRQLTNHSPWRPSIKESEDRLTGLLELAYLTFLVVDTVAGYALIKRALPLFLHLVSNDLELCSERSGQLVVSLPRALLTSRYEIKRFVFYDMMCALVLGVMPLAEYDPGEPLVVMYPPLPTEVFHGIPIEWILIIGHIWARTSDWRNLETQILSWGPRISDIWSEESIELVFRIAIQESWRHAILVYIYMNVCGVDSLDQRVQASVKQIVRLMEVVHVPPMDVHLSTPCIIAGIAARYETQRALIYQKLLSFRNTHIWVLRGADFAPILKHLWHGAGVNGGGVTWCDYINSRCALLPLL
ncbi:fungal Zn(2)-cys(6) binuclear cluster domain protein, putative [Rhizoctonia solani AG-3 Rhs1AP]|uniref:Fungal Zn(2)-cys(6) binuclear cluster domain protein, putative n=2 Tax=Rhizoctonia solani AG-3 TaxID=1086053 RepID=X8IY56_9AGAM|nr:fungal Zn(2)-cys(6) binuclear cluster domain protein, putative [Rhizoctonia solani AG-3 Rhs1AP]KEP50288.1 putative fungal Zn(2)-cys(6) binuclear cluster domain protein [Rhizoctonia solani 123E]